MSVLAAIDIGTNSTRLLVAELNDLGVIKILESALITTRMGEGMTESPTLKHTAIKRTLDALEKFQDILARYVVNDLRVIATSAVRDAENRKAFAELVFKQTGFKVDIISGEEEALLSYRGVIGGLGISPVNKIIVDVGGGSTELIWQNQKGLHCISIPVGAVRMTEGQYSDSDIKEILGLAIHKHDLQGSQLIGVGGTITTLAAIDLGLPKYDSTKVHGYKLSYQKILQIFELLSNKTLEERKQVPGLQPQRADIILAGIRVFKILMKSLIMDTIIVSEADILFGIIFSLEKNIS